MGNTKNKDKKNSFNEFKITQNNMIYNIKLIKQGNGSIEMIKIILSYKTNNIFYIYEKYIDKNFENEENGNLEKIYQNLVYYIKKRKLEIQHDNNNKQFITLNINMNSKIKSFKLIQSIIKDKELLYNENSELKNEINNINNTIEHIDNMNKNIEMNAYGSIWCMLKLNNIIINKRNENLNLIAIGFSEGNIIIIDISKMKIHQKIKTPSTVYSLAQFKDNNKYLICSLSNGQLIIYILKKDKYEIYQTLEKPEDKRRGEINKVITLSDGNLATADRRSLSIWRPKAKKSEKKFEFFKEIITDNDTCQLLEVNPFILVCAMYSSKNINIYKKKEDDYILQGQINNAESHGDNSNGMAKINDNIFCSGSIKSFIYIVSVEPVQIIQKIILNNNMNNFDYVLFLHNSNDGFIFTSFAFEKKIIQLKIINDEEGNFIKLQKFDEIEVSLKNEAIATTNDGKIFYEIKSKNEEKLNFCLINYKK